MAYAKSIGVAPEGSRFTSPFGVKTYTSSSKTSRRNVFMNSRASLSCASLVSINCLTQACHSASAGPALPPLYDQCAAFLDHRLDLRVLARMQRLEGKVLELPRQLMDTEAVRERRVHLERLFRLLDLLLLAEILDLAQVVKAVRELDQDDAHVGRHRDDHLSVVLCFVLLAGLELDSRQLRDAVDEGCDLVAELGTHVLELDVRVLHDVVT